MTIPLDRLLGWAAQGWHVFPLSAGSKFPLAGTAGLTDASADPERIKAWHAAHPAANWAVNCGRSGLAVVDVDVKKADGRAALFDLELEHGPIPPTLTARTTSGGLHYYLAGEVATTAARLAEGIDTRGGSRDGGGCGYVVLPGSVVDGKPYEVISDAPIAPVPAWIVERAGAPAARSEPKVEPAGELDRPTALAACVEYARRAEPAVEGQGGNATTYRVASRIKDMGASESSCVEILAEVYNGRCVPEWSREDLERIVANAYRYGREAPGALDPRNVFTPLPMPEPEAPAAPAAPPAPLALTADTFDAATLPKRPWVLGHRLCRTFVSALVSQGGAGKSSLSLVDALSVATGRALGGDEVRVPGKVWVYNTEDGMDELARRTLAAAQYHKVGREELAALHISSGRIRPLVLASSRGGNGAQEDSRAVADVIRYIQAQGIVVWVVDPFVHAHWCNENDNSEIAVVMLALSKIADSTGCAIQLIHHTRKGTGEAGDMDRARGAGAFGGAVRIMHTLQTMAEEEAESYGIAPDMRRWYVRLDDAKANMAPPSDSVRWFKKVSVTLPNGDEVGTIEPTTLTKVASEDLGPTRDSLYAAIDRGNFRACRTLLDEVAKLLRKEDPETWKGTRDTSVQARLRDAFEGSTCVHHGWGVTVEETNGEWWLRTWAHVEVNGDGTIDDLLGEKF